jgi:putative SOS response-associated peptidase YedK
MWGRFLASKSPEKVALWFTTRNATSNVRPSYDLAPSQDALAIRFNPEVEQRILEALRWGLVRFRAKDIKIGHCLITRSSAPARRNEGFVRLSTTTGSGWARSRSIRFGFSGC